MYRPPTCYPANTPFNPPLCPTTPPIVVDFHDHVDQSLEEVDLPVMGMILSKFKLV